MTHEELLAKIDIGAKFEGATWSIDGDSLVKQSRALRAIVELHKPGETKLWFNECMHCSDYNKPINYPCSTIVAVEKQLI